MSDAALNLHRADKALDLSGSQAGDVTIDSVAGGNVNHHEGVPFDQVATLLTRFLDKQPQIQNLLLAAIESIHEGMRGFGARIDRFSLILVWIASALTGLTFVLAILLAVVLGTLFTVLQPHLLAGRLP